LTFYAISIYWFIGRINIKGFLMSNGRNYSQSTLKKLFGLSASMCNYPGCGKVITTAKSSKESNICHIEALNEGGYRYNQNMTPKERNDYNNLILLCVTHHELIDNSSDFSVQMLKDMKKTHEFNISKKLNEDIYKNPTILAEILNIISENDIENFKDTPVKNATSPEEKIDYNDIKSYKLIIDDLKIFQGKLNTIYIELEKAGSYRISNLFNNIHQEYLKAKINILKDDVSLSNIRENSDALLQYVENELFDMINKSPNKKELLEHETISHGIRIVLVDAFLRCKILETVKDDN
jgi:hypothetical protein